MNKTLTTSFIVTLVTLGASAHTDDEYRKAFDTFKHQSAKEFDDFRQEANMKYSDFLQQAWKEFKMLPAIEKPDEKTLPPVVVKPEDKRKPPVNNPITIRELIRPVIPEPRPQPVAPIKPSIDNLPVTPVTPNPQPTPQDEPRPEIQPSIPTLTVKLYGTEMTVRICDDMRFTVRPNEKDIARAWRQLSKPASDITIYDCLQLRDRHSLSDWAYLRLLTTISDSFLGKGTDEAELLKAFLFCQSGYKMRLALADNKVTMLYGTRYIIHGKLGWSQDGFRYYSDRGKINRIHICQAKFPGEKPMSPAITTCQRFADNPSSPRTIVSASGMEVTSIINSNYMAFCEEFPSSQYGEDPITRWAIYADTPTSPAMSSQLYPLLRKAIEGLNDFDAVNRLCNWIQTGFEYEYDDKVWGHDRAFFADETLFYPYCDCEDRSILLTRIVRDLLGLPCALVYYPGHLATAIALGEDAEGDYLRIDGKRFLICDPTYINAPIGRTMPGMQNDMAKAILLNMLN